LGSQCLYDNGEELWPVKLHIGCGGVYLRGYTNIDAMGIYANVNGELVDRNETSVDDYYARLDGTPNDLPARRQTVVDEISDVASIRYAHDSVDKILGVQVFEHLSPSRAIIALNNWRIILKQFGVLILSVPDMVQTVALIKSDGDFAIRHMLGRDGDLLNSHKAWYTPETLIELLDHNGFSRIERLPNFHFYPAIVVRALKV
jgi:hypothetical protein